MNVFLPQLKDQRKGKKWYHKVQWVNNLKKIQLFKQGNGQIDDRVFI